jgi:uncharacterized protein YbaR (Trm112 family)
MPFWHMNNSDPFDGLALKATMHAFLAEVFQPEHNPEDNALFATVREFVDHVFRTDLADFLWFAPWLRSLCKWYARWRVIAQLRALQLDPAATLEALDKEIQAYFMPSAMDSGTKPVAPELLELLRCPVDGQPLEMRTGEQSKVWLINPRNGYCYPVDAGIPILLEEEGRRHQNDAFIHP